MTNDDRPTADSNDAVRGYATDRDNAAAFWSRDALWIYHATSEDTVGRQTIVEVLCPQGAEPGPHTHAESDESFYVLDGEASFTVGEQTIDGSPGSFVYIPRNTRHTFDMRIKAVRVLNTYSPAGPGEFAKE